MIFFAMDSKRKATGGGGFYTTCGFTTYSLLTANELFVICSSPVVSYIVNQNRIRWHEKVRQNWFALMRAKLSREPHKRLGTWPLVINARKLNPMFKVGSAFMLTAQRDRLGEEKVFMMPSTVLVNNP